MKRIFIPAMLLGTLLTLFTASCKKEHSSDDQVPESVVATDTTNVSEIDTASSETTETTEPEKDVANESTGNYDQMLDAYEEYIDKYIVVMKKMKNNDMSVMDEYTELADKADEFSKQLDGNEKQMSKAQLKRYTDLTAKFTKAMTEGM